MQKLLNLYTIYKSPRDYPGEFVARRFEVGQVHGDRAAPREVVARGPTLESVRAKLPPGLHNIGRETEDEAQIVETWL